MDFDGLNDDDILHIFSFLGSEDLFRVRQVCPRWRKATDGSPSLWWNVKVTLTDQILDFRQRNISSYRTLKVAPVLGKLEIFSVDLTGQDFSKITSKIIHHHPKKLRKLSISCDAISGHAFSELLQCFDNHLEELEFDDCLRIFVNPTYQVEPKELMLKVLSIDVDSYRYIFKDLFAVVRLVNLEELNLTLKKFTHTPFEGILSDPSSLEEVLELDECTFLCSLKDELKKLSLEISHDYGGYCRLIYDSHKFINYFSSLKMLCFISQSFGAHFKWLLGDTVGLDVKFSWRIYDDLSSESLDWPDLRIGEEALNSVQNLTFRFVGKMSRETISNFLERFPILKKLNYSVVENDWDEESEEESEFRGD